MYFSKTFHSPINTLPAATSGGQTILKIIRCDGNSCLFSFSHPILLPSFELAQYMYFLSENRLHTNIGIFESLGACNDLYKTHVVLIWSIRVYFAENIYSLVQTY